LASDEFDIIRRHFNQKGLAFAKSSVMLGIGDDCALLAADSSQQLAISMDLLQEGVHFLSDADPFLLGQRTLLVNLSDLAAMGAEPLCFTLGVSIPKADELWLERFSAGLAVVAQAHDCPLVGGDLTAAHPEHGTITLCVQVHGQRPAGAGMLRSGARPGDLVYVTGTLGDAAAGLAVLQGRLPVGASPARDGFSPESIAGRPAPTEFEAALISAFYQPESRVACGMALRGLASAAIDISDGLASDLGHILRGSGVSAAIDTEALPTSAAFRALVPEAARLSLVLGGGDDYELCFTVSNDDVPQLERQLSATGTAATCIGRIESGSGPIRWLSKGEEIALQVQGYNHFAPQQLTQERT